MKIKKRLLLAGLIAIVAVLGVSVASALAAVWKDKGTNVSKLVEFSATGGEQAEDATKGVNCALKVTFTTEGGSTGKITKWEPSECTPVGELKGCTVTKSEPRGLPWTVDVNETDLTITSWRIKRTFSGSCGITEIDKTISEMSLTLDSTTAITEMEFNGVNGAFKSFGSFTIDSPNSGTYGIG